MWPRVGSSSRVGRTRTSVTLALSKEVSDSRLVDIFVFLSLYLIIDKGW